MAMNHRERVLAALNHEQPDRVPIDLSGHRSSGISAITYRKLRAALGLEERTIRIYDPLQQLAIVDLDVLDHLAPVALVGVGEGPKDLLVLGAQIAVQEETGEAWRLPGALKGLLEELASVFERQEQQREGAGDLVHPGSSDSFPQ
jgi:uroporphyrinogen decarboxylase